jgi:hypothetical protein
MKGTKNKEQGTKKRDNATMPQCENVFGFVVCYLSFKFS